MWNVPKKSKLGISAIRFLMEKKQNFNVEKLKLSVFGIKIDKIFLWLIYNMWTLLFWILIILKK